MDDGNGSHLTDDSELLHRWNAVRISEVIEEANKLLMGHDSTVDIIGYAALKEVI